MPTFQDTISQYGVQIGNANKQLKTLANGASGTVLTSNGASADPTWETVTVPAVNFYATQTANLSNVTGNSVIYTIPFSTVIYDSASAYNTGTGQYTIPSDGYYSVNTSFRLGNVGSQTRLINYLNVGGTTVFVLDEFSPGACKSSNNQVICKGTFFGFFSSGDVVTIATQVIGGSQTVGVSGTASTGGSNISVFQIQKIN